MKTSFDNDALGDFSVPGEVRLIRILPGPIDHVWLFLTDPKRRARWFCGGELEQNAGGKIIFAMRHKDLAPDETPPPDYAQVHDPGITFEGRVLKCESPRLLSFTFGSRQSVVTFELTPQGKQVVLVLTHRTRGPEQQQLSDYASGWHTHLTQLVAQLEKRPRPPFWGSLPQLKARYHRIVRSAAKS
jgi:uncharacterized protein YndB with AHSA1/START domain